MTEEPLYYIQNRKPVGNCVLWWCVDGHGYTCDLSKAWKVNADEARSICSHRKEDVAWPAEDIDRLSVRHFDFQKFRELKRLPVSERERGKAATQRKTLEESANT